jgi:hypothetical protein
MQGPVAVEVPVLSSPSAVRQLILLTSRYFRRSEG